MEERGVSRWEAMGARAREQLARNPLYQQPGWVVAHSRLLAVLPNAAERIPAQYRMTPDPILGAATEAGVLVESVLMFNLGGHAGSRTSW